MRGARPCAVVLALGISAAALVACSGGAEDSPAGQSEESASPTSVAAPELPPIRRDPDSDEGKLGEPVRLALGRSAYYAADDLEVRFVRVAEDSRCPIGVECIQTGQAKVSVQIKAGGGIHGLVQLTLGAPDGLLETRVFGGHTLTLLALSPHPGTPDGEPEYVATLAIGRGIGE